MRPLPDRTPRQSETSENLNISTSFVWPETMNWDFAGFQHKPISIPNLGKERNQGLKIRNDQEPDRWPSMRTRKHDRGLV